MTAPIPLTGHASISRRVEWVDTDASGHQHNSAIIRWVEAAEAELLRTLELPDYFPSAPRVHQEITYKSKLWFGQLITARIEVRKLGRTSLSYAFSVSGHAHPQSDGGGVAAVGTVTVAHVPAGAKTAQPWPLDLVEAITRLMASTTPVSPLQQP
jgi:acyl-CoA thioester hydrolase